MNAAQIVEALIKDIQDRRGLKWEWNKIDADVQDEIRTTWTAIVVGLQAWGGRGRCPRCHQMPPNPNGCAICNPEELGRRITEALARCADLELQIKDWRTRIYVPAPPLAIRINCPTCGLMHVDAGEMVATPHRSHACQGCGLVWAPTTVPTVGVQFLPGCKDEEIKAKK